MSKDYKNSIEYGKLKADTVMLNARDLNVRNVMKIARKNGLDVSSVLFEEVIDRVDTMKETSIFLLGLSAVVAIFLFIIILNYLLLLVKERNKELGIMRGLGTSGAVTVKIFYIEIGLLDIIVSVISAIIAYRVVSSINGLIGSLTMQKISWFSFGIAEFIISVLIFTAFLCIIAYPILRSVIKKQPIDVIRSI